MSKNIGHKMKIILKAPMKKNNDDLDVKTVNEIKKGLHEYDSNVAIEKSDIGHGADWPVLLISFGTLGSIFFLGDKIQKNLDAWISMAKRMIKLFTWLREKYGLARIDDTGAIAIAINDIVVETALKLTSLSLESCQTICFTPIQYNPPDRLDAKPDSLYIITIKVNEDTVYIYGIKSNGIVEFKHSYLTNWVFFSNNLIDYS